MELMLNLFRVAFSRRGTPAAWAPRQRLL